MPFIFTGSTSRLQFHPSFYFHLLHPGSFVYSFWMFCQLSSPHLLFACVLFLWRPSSSPGVERLEMNGVPSCPCCDQIAWIELLAYDSDCIVEHPSKQRTKRSWEWIRNQTQIMSGRNLAQTVQPTSFHTYLPAWCTFALFRASSAAPGL